MESRFKTFRRVAVGLSIAVAFCATSANAEDASGGGSLAQRIFEVMAQVPGTKPGFRLAHAKGIVCDGTFAPSKSAAAISKAAHFQREPVPVTVRLSGGAVDPALPDYSPDAGPQGLAIRFKLPGGGATDIV